MTRFATTIAATAFLLISCASAGVIPLLDSRAPHFAEILQPVPNYFLLLNSTEANATFLFLYRDGERSQESTMSVSLQNATAIYPLAAGLEFIDNWYTVNTTITVPSNASFADGNYTLLVQEFYQGQVISDLQQGFALSHDPTANVTLSEQAQASLDGSLASATATAYWAANPAAASSQSAAPVAAAAAAQTTSAAVAGGTRGAGSIGDSLRNFLSGFVATRR